VCGDCLRELALVPVAAWLTAAGHTCSEADVLPVVQQLVVETWVEEEIGQRRKTAGGLVQQGGVLIDVRCLSTEGGAELDALSNHARTSSPAQVGNVEEPTMAVSAALVTVENGASQSIRIRTPTRKVTLACHTHWRL
jgi:hypothetical protein